MQHLKWSLYLPTSLIKLVIFSSIYPTVISSSSFISITVINFQIPAILSLLILTSINLKLHGIASGSLWVTASCSSQSTCFADSVVALFTYSSSVLPPKPGVPLIRGYPVCFRSGSKQTKTKTNRKTTTCPPFNSYPLQIYCLLLASWVMSWLSFLSRKNISWMEQCY